MRTDPAPKKSNQPTPIKPTAKTDEDIEAPDGTETTTSEFNPYDEAVNPEKEKDNDKTNAPKTTEAFDDTESTTTTKISNDEKDNEILWKIVALILTATLVVVIIVAAFLVLCVRKNQKVINIYNLGHDSSILNNESRTIFETFINRPMPPVPSPCPKKSDQNHSYYYPNILQTGISTANKGDYELVPTKENHSYYYPEITNEVLQQIARESALQNQHQ